MSLSALAWAICIIVVTYYYTVNIKSFNKKHTFYNTVILEGCSQDVFFTEVLAEFQHVNCMI